MEEDGHSVRVSYTYYLPTNPPCACRVRYEVFGDGTVETTLSYRAVPGLPDMPEFGMLFRLPAALDRMRWYGLGPEENYADRLKGARLGVWEQTVDGNMARYLRPQESGNRCGVRWMELTDGDKAKGMPEPVIWQDFRTILHKDHPGKELGMIERFEEELGYPCKVVATGGLSKVIVPHCRKDVIIDPMLMMKGLKIIYDKNK